MTNTLDNLIVYQASAGSGKTYKLVLEYLTLLFEGLHSSGVVKYNAILVVTFTNKATVELRERILKMLYELSLGAGSMKEDLLKADWDGKSLSRAEKEAKLKEYASRALKEILEDYAYFRVQTIDSFFQEVVRSFVLEIDRLHKGFEIELDKDSIVALSLDDMLREMSRSGSDNELDEAVRFLYDAKKDEDERVRFRDELSRMMKGFIDDPLSVFAIAEKDLYLKGQFVDKAIHSLKAIKETIETRVLAVLHATQDFLRKLPDKHGLPLEATNLTTNLQSLPELSDVELMKLWGKGPEKLGIGKTISDYLEGSKKDPCFWGKNETERKRHRQALTEVGGDIFEHLSALFSISKDETLKRHYLSSSAMLKYLRWIPVLLKFRERIDTFQSDNGIVLISEINTLLEEIIAGSDTPFIYDKVGTRIEHYLIDEFQDTNAIQWHNFLPLLAETLANGKRNYIVGDVKQSIYRFRGGDSELLGSVIPRAKGKGKIKLLDKNYRSRKEIVAFNNAFFGGIYDFKGFSGTDIELPAAGDHAEIYSEQNVHQDQPTQNPKQGGYVSVRKEVVDQNNLQELLLKLHADGYRPGDIAILVRRNKEAAKIADMLNALAIEDPDNREAYRYISGNALLVANSHTVQVVVAFLRHMAHPGLKSAEDLFEVSLYNFIPFDAHPDKGLKTEELKQKMVSLSLSGLSMYEVVNGLIDCLREVRPLSDEELVYINAFLDRLFDFSGKYPATYGQFDEWWQAQKDDLYVEMSPTAPNAIQLHTIHTVKGLEYPVVILPYGDWEIVPRDNHFGQKKIKLFDIHEDTERDLIEEVAKLSPEGGAGLSYPEDPRYYFFHKTPTDENINSIFRKALLEELEAEYMDALNLLYVAFTRPTDRLYVFLGKGTAGTGKIIQRRFEDLKGPFGFSITDNQPYEQGLEEPKTDAKEEAQDEEITTLSASPKYDDLTLRKDQFKSLSQDRGILLHRIMEGIRTARDADDAFGHYRGEFAPELEAFKRAVSDKETPAGFFFNPPEGWETLIEHSMYSHFSRKVLRTDRLLLNPVKKQALVLDYKFGEERGEYRTKIQLYLRTLKEMGYDARGFLWYNLDKMEEVPQP